jgi:hypothetical protein
VECGSAVKLQALGRGVLARRALRAELRARSQQQQAQQETQLLMAVSQQP